ncbi:MAG: HlyD family efflux transporter periplasmic adaptor subunit [Rubrivivax sp.]|nr:MAG: HlyD family efflux transporter periplasmic adaptor subunit [Rubrivivax sp.]
MVERLTPAAAANPLLQLLTLGRQARAAGTRAELAFLLVNDTHGLWPYRQAALWQSGRVTALSGVVEPESNAPYVHWLLAVARHLAEGEQTARALTAADLPAPMAADWAEWWPTHALWLPLEDGALLLAGDEPAGPDVVAVLAEWLHAWQHAWRALQPRSPWQALRRADSAVRPWWKRRRTALAAALLLLLAVPVRLSVLAPGELVPAKPVVVRAPVDGVLGQFQVQPNQVVKAGQPLFGFDEASLAAHRQLTAQGLATAQAEYRQQAQQAVSDTRSKAQLSALLGKIEERRAEADFSRGQLERAHVVAPQDGIVLFDDPSEWIGKPVQTGERILRIATPGDIEVEAWLPIGDAIELPEGATVELYLAADPLTPITARVRYVAFEAQARPDGSYAYRVRAQLQQPVAQRVGLKGTAKLSGERVPLAFWLLRRPWATLRQTLGL